MPILDTIMVGSCILKIKLGPLQLGLNFQEVQRLMGQAHAREDFGEDWELRYGEGLRPRVVFKNSQVSEIVSCANLTVGEHSFEEGDSFQELVKVLGEPYATSEDLKNSDPAFLWEEKLPMAAMFDFEDSRLMVNVDPSSGNCQGFTLRSKTPTRGDSA